MYKTTLAFNRWIIIDGDLIRIRLKKQSQFAGERNGRKYIYERVLWGFWHFRAAKKQSQFKANRQPLTGNAK
ncbi:hypothetical protein ACFL5F_02330 [Planctomycetota bacterium]